MRSPRRLSGWADRVLPGFSMTDAHAIQRLLRRSVFESASHMKRVGTAIAIAGTLAFLGALLPLGEISNRTLVVSIEHLLLLVRLAYVIPLVFIVLCVLCLLDQSRKKVALTLAIAVPAILAVTFAGGGIGPLDAVVQKASEGIKANIGSDAPFLLTLYFF